LGAIAAFWFFVPQEWSVASFRVEQVVSLDGLLGLVALGAVELHPWNGRVENFERADRLVIDLDPGEAVPWEAVVEAALRMREILQGEGLSTWPKLTGGKGRSCHGAPSETDPARRGASPRSAIG
jgi:bifunctional non-homologous end joining protein LigD